MSFFLMLCFGLLFVFGSFGHRHSHHRRQRTYYGGPRNKYN